MAQPTTEIGHGGLNPYGWGNFADTTEDVPELLGIERIKVYNRMRHDAMIAGSAWSAPA